MRKSWLIIGLVVAGGVYYWTGGEDKPETVLKPAPHEAVNSIGVYRQIPGQTFQSRSSRWDSGVTQPQPGRGRESFSAVTPSPELGSYVPPYQEHSFRPLNKREKSLHKPMAAPAYPTPPEWQRNRQIPSDRGYQAYEAQGYDAPPVRSQAAPAPEYKFRPLDSRRQPERWIGNYPRIPSTGPTAPMRSYPPEPGANYAFSR